MLMNASRESLKGEKPEDKFGDSGGRPWGNHVSCDSRSAQPAAANQDTPFNKSSLQIRDGDVVAIRLMFRTEGSPTHISRIAV